MSPLDWYLHEDQWKEGKGSEKLSVAELPLGAKSETDGKWASLKGDRQSCIFLVSWGTRPRRTRRTCQELCKRSWSQPQGRVTHGSWWPRSAKTCSQPRKSCPWVRAWTHITSWPIPLHSCNGHLKYCFQRILNSKELFERGDHQWQNYCASISCLKSMHRCLKVHRSGTRWGSSPGFATCFLCELEQAAWFLDPPPLPAK